MLVNLLRTLFPPSPAGYDRAFVKAVHVKTRRPVRRASPLVLLVGWVAIALKCWAVVWAISYFKVPVNPLWVTAPTVIFAGLCTVLFYVGE
jgi:hypothetical protein